MIDILDESDCLAVGCVYAEHSGIPELAVDFFPSLVAATRVSSASPRYRANVESFAQTGDRNRTQIENKFGRSFCLKTMASARHCLQ